MELGLKSSMYWILDLLFPEHCLGCKNRGSSLCPLCSASIRKAERETSRDISALYDYRDPLIKRAIWSLKYYKKRSLGGTLGKFLYEAFIEEIADISQFTKGQSIYVIPVPLSRTRKKMRGYNQAEAIAKGFCTSDQNKIFELQTKIISKKVNTLPQARITNRVARLKNIKNAFELNSHVMIEGRTIIVIDDVTTTGGTMTEIIQLLKKSGAKKVVGFAVAH